MTKNQQVSVVIFDMVIETTKDQPHTLKQYEMKRPRLSLPVFWTHVVQSLGMDVFTTSEAIKLVWKTSTKKFKISKNLLYKLSIACLVLAEKIQEDQIHTLEAFSLVSGISMKDLRALQLDVLILLQFNLNLSQSQRQLLPQCLQQISL